MTVFEIHTREMHTTPSMAPGVDPPKEQREESTHFVEELVRKSLLIHTCKSSLKQEVTRTFDNAPFKIL